MRVRRQGLRYKPEAREGIREVRVSAVREEMERKPVRAFGKEVREQFIADYRSPKQKHLTYTVIITK